MPPQADEWSNWIHLAIEIGGPIVAVTVAWFALKGNVQRHSDKLDIHAAELAKHDAEIKTLQQTHVEVVRLNGVNSQQLDQLKELKAMAEKADARWEAVLIQVGKINTDVAVLKDRDARAPK